MWYSAASKTHVLIVDQVGWLGGLETRLVVLLTELDPFLLVLTSHKPSSYRKLVDFLLFTTTIIINRANLLK
jgi:hypothetical protein